MYDVKRTVAAFCDISKMHRCHGNYPEQRLKLIFFLVCVNVHLFAMLNNTRINHWRACAVRFTVLGLCVCLLLNITLYTRLFALQTIVTFPGADEGLKL